MQATLSNLPNTTLRHSPGRAGCSERTMAATTAYDRGESDADRGPHAASREDAEARRGSHVITRSLSHGAIAGGLHSSAHAASMRWLLHAQKACARRS